MTQPNGTAQLLPETWPCGCAKGMTPHGAGWRDCIFSDEQKAKWLKIAEQLDADKSERA